MNNAAIRDWFIRAGLYKPIVVPCENCNKEEGCSMHGSCLVCGYQMYPSKYRHSKKGGRK